LLIVEAMTRLVLVLSFATAALASACTSTPSGAACPSNPADMPTYDNFGREFMETYCTGCHSVHATNRHGAPDDQNYDTEADVKKHAAAIDAEAAAGPNAMNTAMPELAGSVHAPPTNAEREKLGQWIACMQQ
jgi:uncharacterized membrane protein